MVPVAMYRAASMVTDSGRSFALMAASLALHHWARVLARVVAEWRLLEAVRERSRHNPLYLDATRFLTRRSPPREQSRLPPLLSIPASDENAVFLASSPHCH